jgi:hypothetical protein
MRVIDNVAAMVSSNFFLQRLDLRADIFNDPMTSDTDHMIMMVIRL